MSQFDPRAMFTRMLTALNERDIETLRELIHPDAAFVSSQSGERSRGVEAFLAEGDNYPGGVPEVEVPASRVVIDEDRWAITPSYTVVPLASPTSFTVIMKIRYPDGVTWFAVMLTELRDNKIAYVQTFYAPELAAPLPEAIASYKHG